MTVAIYEDLFVLTEIVRCFNKTLQNDPSISEAVAAIQTLLEVIQRSNGELEIVHEQIFRLTLNKAGLKCPSVQVEVDE